ncbi:hypothetical protein M9Y10_028407 [Tritrichomonas musculus]|uniref:Non-specific serine/threonine protein kinase n=1 Tax=Tritrichomonas musculus TaxID=1915356 RepID=A0ABR2KKC0_9EUKA
MKNRPNDQIRRRLAISTIENIFKIQIKDDIPSFVRDLFTSLIKFDFDSENIFSLRELIQKPQNPAILTEFFSFLHTYFQTSSNFSFNNENENNRNDDSQNLSNENFQDINSHSDANSFNGKEFLRAIIDSVGINVFNVPSLSSTFTGKIVSTNDSSSIQPLDGKLMKLLYYAAQLASLFVQFIPIFLANILIPRSKGNKKDSTESKRDINENRNIQEMQIDLNMINSDKAQYLISFFNIVLSFSGPSEDHLILLFEPAILKLFKKFSLKPIPFSVLCLMSSHKKSKVCSSNSSNLEENKNQIDEKKADKRSLKTVVSFYKSLGSKSQSPSNETITTPSALSSQVSSSNNLTVANSSSSSSDFIVIRILTPIVIRIAITRLNKSIIKELPSMISLCASNIYNDQHTLQLFSYFIDQVMIYSEAPQLIKSKCEKIFDLYLQNISEKKIDETPKKVDDNEHLFNFKRKPIENEIISNSNNSDLFKNEYDDNLKYDEEYNNSDPSNYIKPNIGAAFCLVMEKCKVSPFENGFFSSRINEKLVDEVLMMAFYIINHVSVDYFQSSSYESLIPLCLSLLPINFDEKDESENAKEDKTVKNLEICENFTFQLLIHYCAAIVVRYKSKIALSFLIQAVDIYGSIIASKVLSKNDADLLSFIFPTLARAFKPDKSHPILAITIKDVLKNLVSYGISFTLASTPKLNNTSLLVQNPSDVETSSDSSSEASRSNSISSFISMQHQHSCSNFFISDNSSSNLSSISDTNLDMHDFDRINNNVMPDSLIETMPAPTDATILFCNVILSLEEHQYLFPLLSFSAAALSTHFSSALMKHFPKPFYKVQNLAIEKNNDDDISKDDDTDFEFENENNSFPSPRSFDDLKIDFLVSLHNRNRKKRKSGKMRYKKLKVNHKFKTGCLACYGNALQFLDVLDIYSLSQTFLMLLPGQAMLLLGITLQRLPRSIVSATLEKTTPFILANPDEAGRMIALVSFSYPDVALSFIENNIIENSPLKKRFFAFSLFSKNYYEKYIQTLIVVYKTIGYCSVFFDTNHFISIFLPFATRFLNQYLTDRYSMTASSTTTASASTTSSSSSSSSTANSNSLHMTALFAIRKLCDRVGKWQDAQMDHMFPFKDFLVQYVSSYYMEVGDLIIMESNPIHLISSSDQEDSSNDKIIENENNNKVEESDKTVANKISPELVELVPCILSTLSALLPLRPLRPSEKHEKSIELTAVLIQIIDNNISIMKGAKLFFSTLLNCNPSINVFIGILLPIFPALLYHKEWKRIAEIVNYLCNKCVGSHSSDIYGGSSKLNNMLYLNIQLSSDILSKSINDIGILISYVLPLTISKEACQIAFSILYSLVFIQCTIRNQILSLPQSIRPIKPDIDSIIARYNLDHKDDKCYLEINSVICSYLAKNFTTSQTFDVIFILLDFFEGKKLRTIHRIGVANSIKMLLKERGSEEFKYDSKIIQLLISAISSIENEETNKRNKRKSKEDNDKAKLKEKDKIKPTQNSINNNSDFQSNSSFMKKSSIISIFLEIFELMINMRPFSVLSNIISLNDTISDCFLKQLVNNVIISKIEKGGGILLGVVADSFENIEIDIEKEELTMKFAWRTLPLLYSEVHEINHEAWIKLFKGITKNEQVSINDTLIKMLAGVKGNSNYPKLASLFSQSKSNIDTQKNNENDIIDDDYHNLQNSYFSFAKIIADERILVLPVLLSSFPEVPSPFFINLSIAFAAASKETFFIFIEYAISAMIKNGDDLNLELFGMLKLIFDPRFVEFEDELEKIEELNINLTAQYNANSSYNLNNSKWAELCESLTALFIRYMLEDTIVVDCAISFLKRIGYSCPHKPKSQIHKNGHLCTFWKSLIEICLGNINSWISIVKRLTSEGEICFNIFSDLLPLIIVNAKKQGSTDFELNEFTEIIELIAKKLNISFDLNDEKKYEKLCVKILRNDIFDDSRNDFLNSFVTLMNDPKYINACCIMIGNLCDTLTDENCFALSALIGQMPNDAYTYSFVIETLMRLLK